MTLLNVVEFLVKFRWKVVFKNSRTFNTNNSIFNNTTSQRLFLACALCAEFGCDLLLMTVPSHMNNQLILIDNSKVLRLWRPENSYVWFFSSVQLLPQAINEHYKKHCGCSFGIQLLFWGNWPPLL